jgi:ATP-binding cassette subfamily B protein
MAKLKGRTVLYVTHRLSSIVNADLIVLMGAGEILEVGTHRELIERKGSYFSLYNQQGTSMS